MENDGERPHGPDILSLIQDADAEVVVFNRAVQEVLVAPVDRQEQVFIEAEIAPPDPVVGNPVTMSEPAQEPVFKDRKSTRLNSSHHSISYAVFCLKKKK